ncbi:MerR family transcriptional regulator [Leptolyngbyaceae cyanobacterium CCMR0082]|uniref:MerR family transcriptional regulator n=1 Tax=Adonisia turfae CCMR0082 TaxID=2304604 RepID=A0A6M0SFN5_9CYAN|nr:MerR family transcriptional regulator [Adonisia turfae]MDV3349909.1 MerR family transcriptional regulator [Leptothoe sp. LEGE 181152]NEZ66432.1 MerR family transcriptional regulator [Adonisia turfae CCMR0082]
MTTELTIRQAAKATGLSIHTLRYYEKVGLLAPIYRASNGHRRYSAEDIAWLEFLVRLRETGMPIKKVIAFADLVRQHPNEVSERRVLLEEHRNQVKQHLEELTHHLQVINLKIEHYQQLEATGENDHNCIFWKHHLEKSLDSKLNK